MENVRILFIGLGGSGSKTLRKIKENVGSEACNFLMVDTHEFQYFHQSIRDIFDEKEEFIFLGGQNPRGFVSALKASSIRNPEYQELCQYFPVEDPIFLRNIPEQNVSEGASRKRYLARLLLYMHRNRVKNRVVSKIQSLQDPQQQYELKVVLVSGCAGGTGSGIFYDFCKLINSCKVGLIPVLVGPSIHIDYNHRIYATLGEEVQINAFAFFEELAAFLQFPDTNFSFFDDGSQSFELPYILFFDNLLSGSKLIERPGQENADGEKSPFLNYVGTALSNLYFGDRGAEVHLRLNNLLDTLAQRFQIPYEHGIYEERRPLITVDYRQDLSVLIHSHCIAKYLLEIAPFEEGGQVCDDKTLFASIFNEATVPENLSAAIRRKLSQPDFFEKTVFTGLVQEPPPSLIRAIDNHLFPTLITYQSYLEEIIRHPQLNRSEAITQEKIEPKKKHWLFDIFKDDDSPDFPNTNINQRFQNEGLKQNPLFRKIVDRADFFKNNLLKNMQILRANHQSINLEDYKSYIDNNKLDDTNLIKIWKNFYEKDYFKLMLFNDPKFNPWDMLHKILTNTAYLKDFDIRTPSFDLALTDEQSQTRNHAQIQLPDGPNYIFRVKVGLSQHNFKLWCEKHGLSQVPNGQLYYVYHNRSSEFFPHIDRRFDRRFDMLSDSETLPNEIQQYLEMRKKKWHSIFVKGNPNAIANNDAFLILYGLLTKELKWIKPIVRVEVNENHQFVLQIDYKYQFKNHLKQHPADQILKHVLPHSKEGLTQLVDIANEINHWFNEIVAKDLSSDVRFGGSIGKIEMLRIFKDDFYLTIREDLQKRIKEFEEDNYQDLIKVLNNFLSYFNHKIETSHPTSDKAIQELKLIESMRPMIFQLHKQAEEHLFRQHSDARSKAEMDGFHIDWPSS